MNKSFPKNNSPPDPRLGLNYPILSQFLYSPETRSAQRNYADALISQPGLTQKLYSKRFLPQAKGFLSEKSKVQIKGATLSYLMPVLSSTKQHSLKQFWPKTRDPNNKTLEGL